MFLNCIAEPISASLTDAALSFFLFDSLPELHKLPRQSLCRMAKYFFPNDEYQLAV
jgi:hypothetical protein